MKSKLGNKAQDDFDFGFQMDGAELYTGFQFAPHSASSVGAACGVGGNALTVGGDASDVSIPVEIPRTALTSEAVKALDAQSGPTSSVSMATGGITINLLFDAAAMAAPASFRAGIQQAASILTATISDKITVNISVDYSGTGGGAAAGPSGGLYLSYSTVKADLIGNATAGDATFNALPNGSSIQGQSYVAVWNAQLKLWGVLGANNTTTADGSATFATDINSNLLVGVALHELTHAMGRVPYGAPQSSSPDIFDLFRFTSPGTRLISGADTAPAAYFSLDGGNTKLADYGQNSDPSDFLNSGVQGYNDPFNEYYGGGTLQGLTTADEQQLDALGFHTFTPTTTVIEALGSTSLVQVGSYYYLDSISSGSGPALKFGGAPVVAGQFGAWAPIGAEKTATGYQVALKDAGTGLYSAWNTDNSGNYLSNINGLTGQASGTSYALELLETSFHQDMNGDGQIGLVTTAIETRGVTDLTRVADHYFLYDGGGSGPSLKFGGVDYIEGQFGAWAPIGAEKTATGYQVVMKDASTGLYSAWNTDNNGNYVSNINGLTGQASGTSYALELLETSFHQDLNGDGQIGLVTTAIETRGVTDLTRVADHYFLYDGGGSGPSLKFGGVDYIEGQFGAWAPIGAEKTATGYQVVMKDAGTGLYSAWNTDNSGNYVSNISGLTGQASGTSYALELLETSFHQDLNGDGQIGLVTTAIETRGVTDLTRVADHYFLYDGGGSGPSLKFGGVDYIEGQFGAWAPIGAEKTATGYQVVMKDASTGLYSAWNTDNNGNYVSNISGLTGHASVTDPNLQTLETSFHQDLNGDGIIGHFASVLDGHLGGQTLTSSGVGPTALIGGPNDIMNAGDGADTFVFRPNFGSNTVNGFAAGQDSIQFDHAVFADISAVQSHMQQLGPDVVIAEDAQNLVTLHNVLLANLHASDFQFI